MKIGLISETSLENNLNKNVTTMHHYAKTLSQDVDMICFGEAFLQGFNALTWDYNVDQYTAISADSDIINKLKSIARHYDIAIGFGYFEHVNAKEQIFCSYMVIDNEGKAIYNYRRVSAGWKAQGKTDHHYKEGISFHALKFKERKIVVNLCGDLWSDALVKQINNLRKDAVLWPLHIDYTRDQWQSELANYTKQASKVNASVFMVNNHSKTSLGGCYHFNEGKVIDALNLGSKGALIVEL